MFKRLLFFLAIICLPHICIAEETKPIEQLFFSSEKTEKTPCANQLFREALTDDMDELDENMPENELRVWLKETLLDPSVLVELLDCPEIANIDELDVVDFDPLGFEFENGRTVTVNYSTQPKVLKQKLLLEGKKSIPDSDNPDIQDESNGAVFMNSEPSWYGILVVQHDSLSQFVGPDKNNVIAVDYIIDNIKDIYPKGYMCVSKSALANNNDTINTVIRKKVVNLEAVGGEDTNDYYVYGDKNLEWIMYAEIIADAILTVVTFGGGAIVSGALKGARAARVAMKLAKAANKLKKFKNVEKFMNFSSKIFTATQKAEKAEKSLKYAAKYEKALHNARKFKGTKKGLKYEKKAQKYFNKSKKIDSRMTTKRLNTYNLENEAKNARQEIEATTKELKEFEKGLDEGLSSAKSNLKNAEKAAKEADPDKLKKFNKLEKELSDLKDIEQNEDFLKREKQIKKNRKVKARIQEIEKEIADMKNADKNISDYARAKNEVEEIESVGKYKKTTEEFGKMAKYLKGARPRTGNIFARTLKTMKAGLTKAPDIGKARRTAAAGMSSRSAKLKNWLFDQTLKNGARLAQFEAKTGLAYGALNFLGEMYDKTSTVSKEYSNGIEFKPFCLLAADDLEGYENVVNYGMWLMWTGASTDPADDDAAFLEASDFASKFAYALNEYMEDSSNNISSSGYCNVDVYVVSLIVQLDEENLDEDGRPTGKLFYLVMNDVPWTSHDAFRKNVSDIAKWNQEQDELEENDPNGKYDDPRIDKVMAEYGLNIDENYNANPSVSKNAASSNNGTAVNYTKTPTTRTIATSVDKNCAQLLTDSSNIIRSSQKCDSLSGTEKTRCKKCMTHVGTYENGKCYIEIVAWTCPERGWTQETSRSCNDAYKYNGCGIIKKYVDVEQPFTCPLQGEISGCCHHASDTHPPLTIGTTIADVNCKLPLSSNLDWRIAYDNGSAIGIGGGYPSTREWCMPNAKSHPWNEQNRQNKWTHCGKTISGGTSLNNWYSLN